MRPVVVCLLLLIATPAAALVVETPSDATGRAPEDDPGWSSVGRRGISSAVHLKDGWVITAAHAGVGEVVFGESVHTPVPGTTVHLRDGGGTQADLMMFRVTPTPELPELPIHHVPMQFGTPVVMIGHGKGAGADFEWNGVRGFRWSDDVSERWGTNRVIGARRRVAAAGTNTWCFQTDFSREGTPHEAQAAFGDSGGAVFVKREGQWKLSGVILYVGKLPGQPGATSVYGDLTNAADLSFYRIDIIKTIRQHALDPPTPTEH